MNRALIKSFIPPIVLDAVRKRPEAVPSHGYLDAAATVAEAKAEGVSICQLRESHPNGPGRPGRRDRIIDRLATAGVFRGARTICEIGPGTGMFTERALQLAKPDSYEFYEVSAGWSQFLVDEYGLTRRHADGATLAETPDASRDLIQAYAVFVYIPLFTTLGYLRECVRAVKPGGLIVFDCFTEAAMATVDVAEAWERTGHKFAVILPRALLDDFAASNGLTTVAQFSEEYAAGRSEYFVWRR